MITILTALKVRKPHCSSSPTRISDMNTTLHQGGHPVVCTRRRKPASEDQNGSMGPGTRCAIKTVTFASEKGGMPGGEARLEA
jgi:hypothetical protein